MGNVMLLLNNICCLGIVIRIESDDIAHPALIMQYKYA